MKNRLNKSKESWFCFKMCISQVFNGDLFVLALDCFIACLQTVKVTETRHGFEYVSKN